MTQDTIGIDISKETLDVHRLSDGTTVNFSNDKSGFCDLKHWLSGVQVARIVYEPTTGAYHRDFEVVFGVKSPMVKVNPLQARRFAQARGIRAKTDQVDAKILAVMGDTFTLEPQILASQKQRALKELQVLRLALLKDRTRNSNREKSLTLAISKRHVKARLSLLKRQLEEVDARIQKLLSDDPDTARARDIIKQVCSEKGVDIITGVLSSDHVHMFVSVPPKLAISDLVRLMKGRSSHKVQREFTHLKKRYWGCHFWGRGYFSTTNGVITEDFVLQYLENHIPHPTDASR